MKDLSEARCRSAVAGVGEVNRAEVLEGGFRLRVEESRLGPRVYLLEGEGIAVLF